MRTVLVALLPLGVAAFSRARTLSVPRAIVRSTPSDEVDDKDELIAAVSGGGPASPSNRVAVNELLINLEASNPTSSPATSPLLNGEWELAYNGGFADGILQSPTRQFALFLYAGGYAPATFGLSLARLLPDSLLDVTRTKLTISRNQPRVDSMAELKVAGTASPLKLSIASTLEAESNVRLKETYQSITISENKIDVPEAVQYSRLLFVLYLDEDLLVVRDETGVPEVLVRKEMEFSDTSGGSSFEPSSADDDLSPGAG